MYYYIILYVPYHTLVSRSIGRLEVASKYHFNHQSYYTLITLSHPSPGKIKLIGLIYVLLLYL
jgi:hypothetical protein